MATIVYSFSEYPTKAKRGRAMYQFVKNGTANFGQTGPTEINGPTSEGDAEYSDRKEPKRTFPFDF